MEHPAHHHPYTTTLSGMNIGHPRTFTVDQVRMFDIVESLAKTCRYNGHVNAFYSVAEHSVLVSKIAELAGDPRAIIPALLHDAHEAFSGDIPSPHKDMIAGAHEFERAMELVVREALGLPEPWDDVWRRVRTYDTMILHREVKNLRTIMPDWYDPIQERCVPSEVQPVGLEWQTARRFFKTRLRAVGFLVPENA